MKEGFRVAYERRNKEGVLVANHFPKKIGIASEKDAWEIAKMFARATFGTCENVGVIHADGRPVKGWEKKFIANVRG